MALLDELLSSLSQREPAPLFPTSVFSPEISQKIASAKDDEFFVGGTSPEAKSALRAGLLLLNDDLDASHTVSQSLETPTGSAWHAIMHRREGDAGNSRYWWRLTGEHAAFEDIFQAASKYLQNRSEPGAQSFAAKMESAGQWSPDDFVRACSQASGDDKWLRELQMIEMTTLLAWCENYL